MIVQVALFALMIGGPKTMSGWPVWPPGLASVATVAGAALAVAGGVLALWGVSGLGSNLTALPYPKDGSQLVVSGPYAIVRHPIYSGLIIGALGFALFVHGWLSLIYALVLFIFFDVKSRKEERWLVQKFPDYPEYVARVRKLIPWVY